MDYVAQFLEPEGIVVCKLILREDLAAVLRYPGKSVKIAKRVIPKLLSMFHNSFKKLSSLEIVKK